MDGTKPEDCDALDLRPLWRQQYASRGPAWLAIIELGIDPGQLLHNLTLTPTQRLLQLDEMTRTSERLHGVAARATDPRAAPTPD
jgi:hypothetical protein